VLEQRRSISIFTHFLTLNMGLHSIPAQSISILIAGLL
jgi:hypothetical protein